MKALFSVILFWGAAAAAPLPAVEITAERLAALPAAQVVVLGEVHDNPQHHVHQAKAVAAIAPTALVFEMLTPEQATGDYALVRNDPQAMAAALGWAGNGWPDFAMYHPIFTAAPQAALYGAWVPRDVARAAFEQPAAQVFDGDAARFGLTGPLPADQQTAREAMQMAAHCDALPAELLPGMVAVQRLRDAVLAQSALQALADTGGPVVVITGTGHARTDWGMPHLLRLADPDITVISVGQYEVAPPQDPPHDFWLVTEAVGRPDPCAAFR